MSMVAEWEWKIYKTFILDSYRTSNLLKRSGNHNSRKEMYNISVNLKVVFSGTINFLETSYSNMRLVPVLEIDVYD